MAFPRLQKTFITHRGRPYTDTPFVILPGMLKSSQPIGDDPNLWMALSLTYIFVRYCTHMISYVYVLYMIYAHIYIYIHIYTYIHDMSYDEPWWNRSYVYQSPNASFGSNLLSPVSSWSIQYLRRHSAGWLTFDRNSGLTPYGRNHPVSTSKRDVSTKPVTIRTHWITIRTHWITTKLDIYIYIYRYKSLNHYRSSSKSPMKSL